MAEIGRTTDQTNDGNQHNQQGENLSRQVQEMQLQQTGDRNLTAKLETTDQSAAKFQVAMLGPELAAAQQARFNGLDEYHRGLVLSAADHYTSRGVNPTENQSWSNHLRANATEVKVQVT